MRIPNIIKKDSDIVVRRITILASILFLEDNPHHIQILQGFDDLVMDAAIKPEDWREAA